MVIAPLVAGIGPIDSVAKQVAELERTGSRDVVVSPDAAAKAAIGKNNLDPARRPEAARSGLAQSATVGPDLRSAWTD